jgi:5S rRNA maturation endonuclease (ribonuclease M5)
MRAESPERAALERKAKLLARVLKSLDSSVVIVEGKKDARALRSVGVCGKIVEASGKVRGICSRIAPETAAIILTDNDEPGKELAGLVKDELEGCGISADLQVRRDLRFVLGHRTVEEMPRKMKEFEEKLRAEGKLHLK